MNKKDLPFLPNLFKEKQDFFINLYHQKKLSHAYLFFGDKGVGKATFATLFSTYLETGVFDLSKTPLVDTLLISPNDSGSISIDTAREIKQFLSKTPLSSQRRTVVINQASNLTFEAQGALLKVVEEPPPSSFIIFITSSSEDLFPPLLSRLSKIYFPRFSQSDLTEILITFFKVSQADAKLIARDSHGSIGRALFSLSLKKSRKVEDLPIKLVNIIETLFRKDPIKNFLLISRLLKLQNELFQYNLNSRIQGKALDSLLKL